MARQSKAHTAWRRNAVAVLAFCLAIVPALAANAQSELTPDDISAADSSRRAVSADLETATIEYDTAVARLIELENSLTSLGIELAELEQDLAEARLAAQEIATDRYMYAGSSHSTFFDAASIGDVRVRTSYLDMLSREGTDIIIRHVALQGSYETQKETVAQALANQEQTNAELEGMAATILLRLEEANAEYNAVVAAYEKQEAERRAREEAERLRREEAERLRIATSTTTTTAAPSSTTTTVAGETTTTVASETTTTTAAPPTTTTEPPSGAMTCPVAGAVAFTDTWGAPRSGGRTHQGVDMIAARGTPLVAIEAGTVKRMRNSSLGGITVTLKGSSGDEYYYAHLDAWASGLSVGQSVGVGGLLGTVGNTGNAQYTVPHLHFEHAPGGGAAINPYPLVDGLCH